METENIINIIKNIKPKQAYGLEQIILSQGAWVAVVNIGFRTKR